MSFLGALAWLGVSFWTLLKHWLFTIFVAPFHNANMFWILVPIYLGWIVADFFQEKRGTSLGNAISNGVIPLWAGVDWIRTTVDYVVDPKLRLGAWKATGMFFLATCVLAYGLWIFYAGIKAKAVVKYIGRVRTVTYIVIMFTPVFYDVLALDLQHVVATALFFPLFYYTFELLDYWLPDPESIKEENG